MADAITIRAAGPADAAAIARLHVEVWRGAYRGLAPPDAVAALDVPRRLEAWRAALSPGAEGRETLIAEVEGALAGFVSFGPPSQPALGDGCGEGSEIKHLYVGDGRRGAGLGRRLMDAAFARLAALGHRHTALAVVEANASARRFYRRLGGVEGARFVDAGPLWRSSNVVVSWALPPIPQD